MSLAAFHVVNDSGSLTDGTIGDDAWLQTLLATIDARWSIATITLTGNQNNVATSEADLIIFNNASLLTISGFAAPSPAKAGKPLRYICINARVDFRHQDSTLGGTGSTAANRLVNFVTVGPTPHLLGGGLMVYDSVASRWRLIAHEQGQWITHPYDGTDYTATVGTWTPPNTSATVVRYRLSGRSLRMHNSWTSTVNSNATANLFFRIPNSWSAVADFCFALTRSKSDVAALTVGLMEPSGTSLVHWSDVAGSAYAASAGNSVIQYTSEFELT